MLYTCSFLIVAIGLACLLMPRRICRAHAVLILMAPSEITLYRAIDPVRIEKRCPFSITFLCRSMAMVTYFLMFLSVEILFIGIFQYRAIARGKRASAER